MTVDPAVIEEVRKMREKLVEKKPITIPTQKEKEPQYKSPYLVILAAKNNKRKRMNKKPIRPRPA